MADITITEEELHAHGGHDHDDHDDHHGDKYASSFIDRYLFSLDHKTISKQFLITVFFGHL